MNDIPTEHRVAGRDSQDAAQAWTSAVPERLILVLSATDGSGKRLSLRSGDDRWRRTGSRRARSATLGRNLQECPTKAKLIEPSERVVAMIVRVDDLEY